MIYESEVEVFTRFRGGRILLDANLLLLLLIGTFERDRIERFKRTASYSAYDFDQLVGFLRAFRAIITTPHILTEISNLADSLPDHLQPSWSRHFAASASFLIESFNPAADLMRGDVFPLFGLTDAAIHAISTDTLILTDDHRLSRFMRSQALPVLNLRDLIILSQMYS